MAHPSDPSRLCASDAARLIRDGALGPADLMEACLERIAQREPHIQAFASFDPAAARKQAAHARPGPLHGLPVGVKDVIDTADLPSEYGSPIWRGHRPKAAAAAVAWTRAAGGLAIGKTVTTELSVMGGQPDPPASGAAVRSGGTQ